VRDWKSQRALMKRGSDYQILLEEKKKRGSPNPFAIVHRQLGGGEKRMSRSRLEKKKERREGRISALQ